MFVLATVLQNCRMPTRWFLGSIYSWAAHPTQHLAQLPGIILSHYNNQHSRYQCRGRADNSIQDDEWWDINYNILNLVHSMGTAVLEYPDTKFSTTAVLKYRVNLVLVHTGGIATRAIW